MPDVSFHVTKQVWLKTEADRIESILLSPSRINEKWTHGKLRKALAEIGLMYTLAQIALLNDELHVRGIVEDVPDTPTPVPAPEPVP